MAQTIPTVRFKVVLEMYFGTRRNCYLAQTHVTKIEWSEKRGVAPYTLKSWWTSQLNRADRTPCNPPQTFSKTAAEEIARQIAANRGYMGKSETGNAVVTIVPVEVK